MTPAFYLEIAVISITMLLIIYFNAKSVSTDTADNKLFRMVVLLTIFNLFADWVTWEIGGKSGSAARMINICSNAFLLYYLLLFLIFGFRIVNFI